MDGKQVTKNIFLSISVQLVALLVGFILGMIVPKFISEYQYSYWQMYGLYVAYVGILHFGLVDGIILRYAKYDYADLDKNKVGTQFKILLLSSTVLSVIGLLLAYLLFGENFRYVMYFVCIGIITKNLFTFASYTMQMTNRINKYAILVIIQRLVYGLTVITLLLLRVNNFMFYCLADVLGDLVSFVLSIFFNKELYFAKSEKIKDAFSEWRKNVVAGGILMLANLSAMLLLGGAKMIVQWRWDALTFGKVSFSFSLTSLFLTFISAVSIVLFPSLKRLEPEKLPVIYKKIRNAVSPVLFVVMIMYFPAYWVVEKFLPAYAISLKYLGIILPTVVYSSKVNLLTNNYLKAYRKEKEMLIVNVVSIAISLFAFVLCAYVFNSLTSLLVCIVFATMLNSILAEVVVLKIIQVRIVVDFFIDTALTIAFMMITIFLDLWLGFGAYALCLVIYLIIMRKDIVPLLNNVKQFFRRKKQ